MGITKARGSVYNLNYHLIWVTKYRKEVFITDDETEDMKEILRELAISKGIIIQSLEVMSDHVHMLVSAAPNMSISEIIKLLKGVSARSWFKKHPETKKVLWGGRLWSGSYFASSLGDMSKDIVDNYIKNQSSEYNLGRKRKNKRT